MVERRIDSDIRLIPYYRNDGASLPWSARSTKRHIGRRCVLELLRLAAEKGMTQVTANIYDFNRQSQRTFLAVGFEKTGGEWYTYRLTPETEE